MDFLIRIDQVGFEFFNQSLSSTWLDWFFPFITDLHKNIWFQVFCYPLLLFFYYRKFRRRGLSLFLIGLLSLGLSDWSGTQLFKKTVQRPRPFQTEGLTVTQRSPARGQSFISNHASNMFNFATYTGAYFPPAKPYLYGVALLVGVSRIYNGVHFPLDVVCGGLWGSSLALLILSLVKEIESLIDRRRRTNRP
jgi:undecaprenyl-diphosphatase